MNGPLSRALLALAVVSVAAMLVTACDDSAVTTSGRPVPPPGATTLSVSSGAFENGAPIPAEYTCDGANNQPPVSWSGAPSNAAEFALVMDDADANGFAHWVVVGIPSDATALANPLPEGASAGLNGRGQAGYTGPCPPSGTHHYRITVYALSSPLGLGQSATADQVRSAVASRTIATGELDGTYTRGASS